MGERPASVLLLMRLVGVVALVFLGIMGCAKSGRMADGAKPTPPGAVPLPVAVTPVARVTPDVEPPPSVPGSWEKGTEEGKWTLHGSSAPPLVIRGTLRPIHASSNMTGNVELLGARHGTTPLTLTMDGDPRVLYVFAKARGPIGIAAGTYSDTFAVAGANKWARIPISTGSGEITIPIMDVDVPGERRGQTSPYVVVVTELDEEPKLEPEPRAAVGATDLMVHWSVTPKKCAAEIEMFRCYAATVEIADAKGNAVAKLPIKGGLTGQLGCFPDGTGVHCGGPSGMTQIIVEPAKDGSGTVTVATESQSDGYCPPPEDCTSRGSLGKLTVPAGRKLIPDPKGTWNAAPL
jgi:hypothetical protein